MITTEKLLTDPQLLKLPAGPLQTAIARAADARPIGDVALDDDAVTSYFGCERAALGQRQPVLVTIVAGVRSGKSLMLGAAALKAALTADLSQLMAHEVPRACIVAPYTDNADATFNLLVRGVMSSPVLSKLVVGQPTADTLLIRRPDGRIVEIVVVAAHRGGISLRSRWLVFVGLEEVALFGTESAGAVVNAEELLRAGETRLVRGGQAWIVSSPFGPQGLLYDLYKSHFGKPGRVLVVHAPTLAMNPAFDPEQVAAIRARNEDTAAREYDAQFIDADSAFFDGKLLDDATRASPLESPPSKGAGWVAAWDAATRGNSWTLVLARPETDEESKARDGGVEPKEKDPELEGQRVIVGLARQWTGSRASPLNPQRVIAEVGTLLHAYGVKEVLADQWSFDALRAIANAHGFDLSKRDLSADEKLAMYNRVKLMFSRGLAELAPHAQLVADLKAVRKRATANAIRIEIPRSADGRHADFAPSGILAIDEARNAASGGGWSITAQEIDNFQALLPPRRWSSGPSAGSWDSDGGDAWRGHWSESANGGRPLDPFEAAGIRRR